jgi:hypothetical protein
MRYLLIVLLLSGCTLNIVDRRIDTEELAKVINAHAQNIQTLGKAVSKHDEDIKKLGEASKKK